MPRRVMQGRVVSNKGDKTVIVRVERRVMHPIYKKYIRMSKRYAAHDEVNEYKVGELVDIEECRPLSKRKRWTVLGRVGRSADAAVAAVATEADTADAAETPAAD